MGLAANTAVELILGTFRLKSRVIRRLEQDIYLDSLPELQSELTPVPGSSLLLAWVEDESRWVQPAEIMDVLDPLQILLVNLRGEPTREEQRAYPRVKVGVPLEYGLPREPSQYLTTTLDISVVGLRFPSAFQVWSGLNLKMHLRLGQQSIPLTGEVIRHGSQPREFRGRLQWEVAVRFINLTPSVRRTLQQFVADELARARKKGVNE